MDRIVKRVLLAGGISFAATLLFGTPDLITQILIFIPSFMLAFTVLWIATTFSNKKSQIANRKS
jgi:hypothetical protein